MTAPVAAPPVSRVLRHAGLELRLLLRNGEQLLLTAIIPVGLLVALSLASVPGGGDVAEVLPGVLAISVIAVAFTSLAIATGFERRYDVLRWYGSLPLGRSGLLGGKATAALLVVVGQAVLLSVTALLLGWSPATVSLPAVAGFLLVGTLAFASLGLWLAGSLRPEATLAVANLLWLLLLFGGATVIPLAEYPDALQPVLTALPSTALAEGLRAGYAGTFDAGSFLVLATWGLIGGAAAARWFRWS